MALKFPAYQFTDAQQAVNKAVPSWLALNRLYYADDHWQGGNGWTGPRPEPGNENYGLVMTQIANAFVSQNTIKRVVDRHASAVAGREISWALTVRRPLKAGEQPTNEEQGRIQEAEAALTSWWDERGIQQAMLEATRTSQWAETAPLRLFVPEDSRSAQGTVSTTEDLTTALNLIYLDQPLPDAAAMLTDAKSMGKAGIYLYEDDDEKNWAEMCYLDPKSGLTVIRLLGKDASQDYTLALGGRLLHYQLDAQLLITESVRRNQRLLNKALTMLDRNVDLAGFLERTLLNAQLPGTFEEDSNGVRRFVPSPLHVGPGSTNVFVGIQDIDETGAVRRAQPDIVYRDPVPVTTFEGTKAMAQRAILEDTHQLHAIMAGDATATGEARRQAMAEFESSIRPTKGAVDKAVRWVLETGLAMAAIFAGQPGKYDDLRANADCILFAGPPASDEAPNTINLHARHIISRRTAMGRVGIEDPDAEIAAIEAEMQATGGIEDAAMRQEIESRLNSANQGAGLTGNAGPAGLGVVSTNPDGTNGVGT